MRWIVLTTAPKMFHKHGLHHEGVSRVLRYVGVWYGLPEGVIKCRQGLLRGV